MSDRLIFHIDVNSAFVSWSAVEMLKNGGPDLREIPSIVGGDPDSRRSIVAAKSIPAKKYGIVTGEPVSSALRKCPNLVIAGSNFDWYVKCSRAFKAICQEYTPTMQSFSIDEVFLDMSGMNLICTTNGISIYKNIKIADMSIFLKRFKVIGINAEKEFYVWKNGGIYRIFNRNNDIHAEEYAYAHFSGKNPQCNLSNLNFEDQNRLCFYLDAEEITERLQDGEFTECELESHNRFINLRTDAYEIGQATFKRIINFLKKTPKQKFIYVKIKKGIIEEKKQAL